MGGVFIPIDHCHFFLTIVNWPQRPLRWRHNDHYSVLNHQPHGCLRNRLFRRRWKKTSKLRVTGLCVGNSPGPVNSPHKGPVTRKMFPFDDVIMMNFSHCDLVLLLFADTTKINEHNRYKSVLHNFQTTDRTSCPNAEKITGHVSTNVVPSGRKMTKWQKLLVFNHHLKNFLFHCVAYMGLFCYQYTTLLV